MQLRKITFAFFIFIVRPSSGHGLFVRAALHERHGREQDDHHASLVTKLVKESDDFAPVDEGVHISFAIPAIGFLDLDAKWSARLIGLFVNCWISVPSIMLLATGHLSNRDMTIYESARIDGANRWHQFKSLTLPYMIFTTTPVILSQFVGNFNNFGIFYFLRGGLYMDNYFLASDTDLLINWLYNLSIDNNYYSIGAAISLVIFLITSTISLAVYVRSAAFREEDTFQ